MKSINVDETLKKIDFKLLLLFEIAINIFLTKLRFTCTGKAKLYLLKHYVSRNVFI